MPYYRHYLKTDLYFCAGLTEIEEGATAFLSPELETAAALPLLSVGYAWTAMLPLACNHAAIVCKLKTIH